MLVPLLVTYVLHLYLGRGMGSGRAAGVESTRIFTSTFTWLLLPYFPLESSIFHVKNRGGTDRYLVSIVATAPAIVVYQDMGRSSGLDVMVRVSCRDLQLAALIDGEGLSPCGKHWGHCGNFIRLF